MYRHAKWFGLLFVAVTLPGCNQILDLFQPPDGPVETGSSVLKAFESESELSAYFKRQIDQRNSTYTNFSRGGTEEGSDFTGAPQQVPSADGGSTDTTQHTPGSGDDFSGTTIQEVGVDEADVVKNDGTYLYIIDSLFDGSGSILRIVRVSPPEQMGVVSETMLEGYGRDLYLHGDKVVAITTGGGIYYSFAGGGIADGGLVAGVRQAEGVATSTGEPTSMETTDSEPISADAPISSVPPIGGDDFIYERPHTIVTVVDVTSRSAPVVLSQTKFDGTQSATRMIDGVLHMVLANYQDYYFDVMPLLGRPELDVSGVEVNTLLPNFTRVDSDGTESGGPVVTWNYLYHPVDGDGFGVVSLVSLDVDNDAQFTAVGVVAEPGLIYSSLQAMYLTDTNYDWQGNNRTTTDIYKFAYANRGASPVATGTVQGRILNQYSMGEYAGNLRVATTIDPTWIFDQTTGTGGIVSQSQNSVYVLGESGVSLAVVGKVENIATGESIQSARFMGDKGYVVTFLQTDPLFTMDLSDPTSPRLVGKLEVPGYSTFLTPMDENHVLTVGQYVPPPGQSGNWSVQLSIFDVTDFANPVRSSNVIISADTGVDSEALRDPKAFNYFVKGGMVALPVSIYPDYGGGGSTDAGSAGTGTSGSTGGTETGVMADDQLPEPQGFEGLFVYSATPTGGLTEMGRISTRFDESGYWGSSFTRGVFIGDKVYAVTNLGVREAVVSDVSTVENELYYGLPFVEEPQSTVAPKLLEPTVPIDGDEIPPPDGTDVPSVGAGSIGSSTTAPNSVVHSVP